MHWAGAGSNLRPVLKLVFGAMICGILVSFSTGLIENKAQIGIPENKYYGYPLIWRVTSLDGPTEYALISLAIDLAFWITVLFVVFFILQKIAFPKLQWGLNYRAFLLPLILFIPLGLVMDFVHEFGHAIWGIAAGGSFTYMKIAFFEIYPRFAVTSEFVLGSAYVKGLVGFEYGLFLFAGSLTTNITAWLLGVILLKAKFRHGTQVALKILGFFGMMDLPFYVVLPQIRGLQHWIFLGGFGPEPLIGARKMCIPDPIFYLIIFLTTFGLSLLYFKPLREKLTNIVRMVLTRR